MTTQNTDMQPIPAMTWVAVSWWLKSRKNVQEELQPLWRQCNGPRCQSPTEVDKDIIFTYLLELDLSRVSVSQDAGDKARPAAQWRCQGEPCSLAPTHPLQLLPQSYRETIIIHWAGGAHLPLPPSYLHHSAWRMGFHYLVPRPPVAYKSHTSWDTSLNLHAVALSGAWQKISAMAWPTLHPVKTISRRCKLNYSAHDKINMKYIFWVVHHNNHYNHYNHFPLIPQDTRWGRGYFYQNW